MSHRFIRVLLPVAGIKYVAWAYWVAANCVES